MLISSKVKDKDKDKGHSLQRPENVIPLLRIFDISVSLPCDGLGHIGFPDCSHYCLPGIPDVWTNLLHAFVRQSPFFQPNWQQQYHQLKRG
jgi:hypothetical protein